MVKKLVLLILAGAFILAAGGMSHAAQWANPELLMDARQVKDVAGKPDWVILDCRDLKDYAKGHIPGAISLGKQCKKGLRDATARVFSDVSKYEKLFSKVGIGNDSHVVVYGEHIKTDTMKDTTVAFWILEYLGHDKVHVLNGGIDAWKNAGYGMDNKPTILAENTFNAKVIANRYAGTDEIIDIATGKKTGVQLIDARSSKEFKGEDQRALRAGHVPNTTANIPHKDTFDQMKDLETGKDKDSGFLSPDRVSDFYKDLDRNKRSIAYCQTGTRSTLSYLEMRLLGFKDPANWDESWVVYGSDFKNLPVNDEQRFDFARIGKLEKKIKDMEKKLEALAPKEEEKK